VDALRDAAGAQSQIDWGTATVRLRQQPQVLHVFVLTLGFRRRGFYQACPNETLGQFLGAHERAFEYFGGHTREHLYDRPRTVCQGTEQGRIIWNPTFRAFAEYWSFEPRLCRPYSIRRRWKPSSLTRPSSAARWPRSAARSPRQRPRSGRRRSPRELAVEAQVERLVDAVQLSSGDVAALVNLT
jgi:transposase